MAERREPIDPGATMQVDAIVEDYEDEVGGGMPAPPPLPPKKPSKIALVGGIAVVMLAAALGIVAGLFLFGYLGGPETVAEPAPAPAPRPPPEPPPANVVEMDEVVFDVEEPAEGEPPPP